MAGSRAEWCGRVVASAALFLSVLVGTEARAVPTSFNSGSLIIPMDTGTAGQNDGMLRAYGLVYQLLRHDVPVAWVINPAKSANGDDFTIVPSGALQDVRTGATVAPRAYRGGPFVVDAADAAAATPIVQAWQAAPGDVTVVHRLVGGNSFNGDVARTLVAAPRLAILKDANEQIAMNDLNAAGIPDATGAAWSASSPGILTEADVAGPTTVAHDDGVLLADGIPRYCHLSSMHYNATADTDEVVQEVRAWLEQGTLTQAYMQCQSARVFENASGGLFLTNAGLDDDGAAPNLVTIDVPAHPLTQLDGTFQADSGAVDSIRANDAPGATPDYKTGVTTLIHETGAPLTQRIVELTGRLDGDDTNGRVTYLAGHDYSVELPISSNPQTNGVRLYLNSIFEADCARSVFDADLTIEVTSPAITNESYVTYAIHYTNPGTLTADDMVLTATIPPGSTYVPGTALPEAAYADGILTWNLTALPGFGAGDILQFTVTTANDGSFGTTAELTFSKTNVRTVSASGVTVRDTVAPTVTIPGPPTNPMATSDATPAFAFSTSDAIAATCRIDGDAFAACVSPFTAGSSLADGSHTLEVVAVDSAGNEGYAAYAFTIDTVAPVVMIPGPPTNPTTTNADTPFFYFTVSGGDTPVSTVCRITGITPPSSPPYAPCVSPFTSPSQLADGTYVFEVTATDGAGNVGNADHPFSFTIDGQAPTPTYVPTVTPTPTSTRTATPTVTRTATPTITRTATPVVTATVPPTVTGTPTATSTPVATETPTPAVTESATPTIRPICTPPVPGPTATPVTAGARKCQRAIAKTAAKFLATKSKVLQQCEERVVKGKVAGPCPDLPATTKIAAATAKLGKDIGKACGGADKVCGSNLTNEESPAGLGWPATCPSFRDDGDPACNAAIVDCGDIASCIGCIGERAVEYAIDLSYGGLVPSAAKSALNKCQRAIGKAATLFALARAKSVQKCWDLRLAGKHAGVCPDAAAPAKSPSRKAAVAIAKAERKKITAICKACGGADKRCDGAVITLDGATIPGSGGADDLTPTAVGFPSTCPAVRLPGGAFCEQPVGSLAALVECVDCIGAYSVACVDRASVPELSVYPCECRE